MVRFLFFSILTGDCWAHGCQSAFTSSPRRYFCASSNESTLENSAHPWDWAYRSELKVRLTDGPAPPSGQSSHTRALGHVGFEIREDSKPVEIVPRTVTVVPLNLVGSTARSHGVKGSS